VLPALAIAEALVDHGVPRERIRFVGSRRGMEAQMVPAAGFAIDLLAGRGIQRKLNVASVGAVFGLVAAVLTTLVGFARSRPAVVVTVGGYASIPAALAAWCWRVPVVVTEQNAVAGAANRLVGRWAKAAAVVDRRVDLPRATVTGTPLRPEILAAAAITDAKARCGVPEDRVLVVVTTGSLGARSVNTACAELWRDWADRTDVAVVHVVGRRDFAGGAAEGTFGSRSAADGLWLRSVEYEDDMPTLLRAADVAVCRAGGVTVAELAALGVPAVLVPLPIAPQDHQRRNAELLADVDAAVILSDADCSAATLAAELDPLIRDPERRHTMATAARGVAQLGGADRIAALVLEVLS
jgi:UDP-N-acetylglucosamine:LPS N-acetylglucosamine transferase